MAPGWTLTNAPAGRGGAARPEPRPCAALRDSLRSRKIVPDDLVESNRAYQVHQSPHSLGAFLWLDGGLSPTPLRVVVARLVLSRVPVQRALTMRLS
jgi:hypothetical protein